MNPFLSAACIAAITASASSAVLPTDCETGPQILDRLYSYFGGVASFSVFQSGESVFSGASMGLTINFQPGIGTIAGAAVGTLGISAPDLDIDPAADTFSLSVKGPPTGTLRFYVLVREDDNQNGIIDLADGDDEWQSPEFEIPTGVVTTFNIPAGDFFDTGNGSGNEEQNFNNSTMMGIVIDIHSRTLYSGGLITSPRTLHLDHVGFFVGPQVAPPPVCTGDADASNSVNFADITSVLTNFGNVYPTPGPGDANFNTIVDFADITAVLTNFGATCG